MGSGRLTGRALQAALYGRRHGGLAWNGNAHEHHGGRGGCRYPCRDAGAETSGPASSAPGAAARVYPERPSAAGRLVKRVGERGVQIRAEHLHELHRSRAAPKFGVRAMTCCLASRAHAPRIAVMAPRLPYLIVIRVDDRRIRPWSVGRPGLCLSAVLLLPGLAGVGHTPQITCPVTRAASSNETMSTPTASPAAAASRKLRRRRASSP